MVKIGSYATRILAFDHACEHFREIQVNFFLQVTVLYYVDGDIAVYVSQNIEIQVYAPVNLYYVFLSVFFTFCVLNDHNAAFQFIEPEELVYPHALSRLYVIQNHTCAYSINIHALRQSRVLCHSTHISR